MRRGRVDVRTGLFDSVERRSVRLAAVILLMVTNLLGAAPASALVTFGLEVIVDGDGLGSVTSAPPESTAPNSMSSVSPSSTRALW